MPQPGPMRRRLPLLIAALGALAAPLCDARACARAHVKLCGGSMGCWNPLATRLKTAVIDEECDGLLDLARVGLKDWGCVALGRALAENSRITSVDLFQNGVGDDCAVAIASAMAAPGNRIRKVNLGWNGVAARGVTALAKAIAGPGSRVEDLNLYGNHLGDTEAKILATGLGSGMCKITNIAVERNSIGNAGAMALARAIRNPNSKVKTISFWNNEISEEVIDKLEGAVVLRKTKDEL